MLRHAQTQTSAGFFSRHRFVIIVAAQPGEDTARHCPRLPLSRQRRESGCQPAAAVNSATVPRATRRGSFILKEVVTDGFWSDPGLLRTPPVYCWFVQVIEY